MILIVGLGNPGAKYKNTYHNVGFMVVDELAKRFGAKFSKEACDSSIAECKREGIVLAKPQTFMNLSGKAVRQLVRAYDIDERSELVICYDDIDIPLGKLRLREDGSAGTHNGMRNIVAELNTQEFLRLRVGTKTDELASGAVALLDFVLSKIDYAYHDKMNAAIDNSVVALLEIAKGTPLARVQEKLNRHQ